MSVLESVKSAIGLEENTTPRYRCLECGTEFESASEPDSHWFRCPECDAGDAERLDEE